jgi:formate dehydrogenase major subunit
MPPKSIPIVSAAEQRQRRRAGPKGRAGDAAALAEVQQLLGSDSRARPLLIEHLHKLQDHFGHLGERHLAALASEMRLSQAEVYEVASFYHHFDIVKEGEAAPPRLTVRVCDSLSCELAGARALLERLPGLLGTQVRVLAVPCIGRCEQAPAAALGQLALAAATPASVQAAVESALQADGPAARPLARPPQAALDFDAYRAAGGYALLGACVAGTRSTEQVIGALEHSGLRGLGGAGFPAGRKWRIVRAEPAPRLMAVNIDEGEPGTFKDRHYLERDPHRFIEGLLIAAWAVDIARVYIYLRDEYHDCRALLERELARVRADPPWPGMPPIELRRGAGAYICGEESAMIESIEGKRGMPRLRPPYVAQVGLFGRPTLEHNFETLYWVRDIVEKGGQAVRRPRTPWSPGATLVLGLGPGARAGRQAGAGRHHGARTHRRVLRRHGRGPPLPRLPARRRLGRHPAGIAGRHPAGLRHPAALRLLHRLGRGHRAVRPGPRGRRGAQPDALLPPRVLRAMHALPQRHGPRRRADREAALGPRAAGRPVHGDARRVDLRPRPGRAQPGGLCREVLCRGTAMSARETVTFELDGRQVSAPAGESLLEAARREGVEIPHLCHKPGLQPAGNCRACMVEIVGERTLAPACCRTATPGMKVRTDSERALKSQRLVLELLQADMPEAGHTRHNELDHWSARRGLGRPRFASRVQPPQDLSHPAIAVHLDACIQCTRCLRACRDEQVNDVIGLARRGEHSRIVFDLDDPMGASSCVACGECVQACPTGALAPARDAALSVADRQVPSVCPYCGVGCQLTYHVKDNRILFVEGRDGPANRGRLCVKGRYGFDYAHHPQRLTRPLIRRPDAPPKSGDFVMDPSRVLEVFREASWEEALDLAGGTLRRLRDTHGAKALAGFGSAKGSNEEAYLFQKLVRTGFGSNNVDHCTRLCHASSVVALLEGIGSGAVSNPVMDVARAEVVIVIGANPTVNHPVAATWIKNAVKAGTKLVVMDPRRTDLARHAWRYLQFRPDTDVAMLNALMNVIVTEGLVDPRFIAERTSGFDALRRNVQAYTPEAMAPVCGIDAQVLREVARAVRHLQGLDDPVGHGRQPACARHRQRALPDRAGADDGQIGRPGTGLHPLRGQNNVQGASDAGLIPMMLPDYQHVSRPEVRQRFEQAWQLAPGSLDGQVGLTVVEVMHAIKAGVVRGMYVQGENPAMSDPDANHARESLAALEHLVVQDIFLTETAYLADVILPASAFPEKTGSFTNTDRIGADGPPGAGATRRRAAGPVDHPADRQAAWACPGATAADAGEVFDEMRG